MSLTARRDGIVLKCGSVNCQNISQQSKQLSKVSVPCRSQEYLFGNFSENDHEKICGRTYIS